MENHSGAAERHIRSVSHHNVTHRLPVYQRAVGGAEVDEDDLTVLYAQLTVVPRDSRVNHAQVAVGAAAQQGDGRLKLIGAARLQACAWVGASHHQSGPAWVMVGTAARQVADGLPDLAALHRVPADNPRTDAEHAKREVGNPFEPDPHGSNERVTLLLGVILSKCDKLDDEALDHNVEPLGICLRDLDDEIVRNQRAALCHNGRALVHLMLDCARHFDWLKLGLEHPCDCSLDFARKPSFEALQNSHPSSLPSACYPSDVIRGQSTEAAVLMSVVPLGRVAERQTRTVQVRVPERV